MNKTASQELVTWFNGLPFSQKQEVLRFVYGDAYVETRLNEGLYCGPAPQMVKKGGLYAGPAPASMQTSSRCAYCGK